MEETQTVSVETSATQQGGGSVGAWFESIPQEDLRGFIEAKGFQKPGDLIETYRKIESLAHGHENAIFKPGENATEEDINNFYKSLGRPDTPNDYKLGDSEFSKSISDVMHKAGISLEQSKVLSEHYNNIAEKARLDAEAQQAARVAKETNELRQEWNADFDKNTEYARRAARALGIDDEKANAIQNAIGTKEMMKLFHRVGTGFKEDTFRGADGGNSFGMSPEGARARLNEILRNPTLARQYMEKDPRIMNEVNAIHQTLAGN